MKLKLQYSLFYLAALFFISETHAKNCKSICVPIPARTANPSDPFNAGLTIPAANIQVLIEGECHKHKPTIVFIHGFLEDLSEWSCTQSALKDKYQTLSFDLRGYGKSTRTPALPGAGGEIFYSLQVFADDLHAVLTQLGMSNNIILVGHSLGSSIALNYATTYKGVKKLVFVSGAPLIFVDCEASVQPPCIATFPGCGTCAADCCTLFPPKPCVKNPLCCVYPQSLQTLFGQLGEVIACLDNCLGFEPCSINCILDLIVKPSFLNEQCTSQEFLALQQNLSKFFLAQITSPNPFETNILLSTVLIAGTQDQRNLLSQITVPTLICFGSIDASVDPRNSIYMSQRIKKSILAEFCGKGHELNLTDVENFNKLLTGFIQGKRYDETVKIGKANCCDVCATAYLSTDISECVPSGSVAHRLSKSLTMQEKLSRLKKIIVPLMPKGKSIKYCM